MLFKKNTSKVVVTQKKPIPGIINKARPKLLFIVLGVALVPFLLLVLWTLFTSSSSSKKQKTKVPEIIVTQTPQELAEEATQALIKGDTVEFINLLDTKIKDPNLVNSKGDTLLIAAATLGNEDAVQRLLSMGADVNRQNYDTRDTAILRSIAQDHDRITQMLLYEHANLNLPNNYRQTPMGLAVEKQKGVLIDLFLSNGVKAGLDGETLLRASAKKNLVGVIAMLKGGVNPNVSNSKGNTPLIISASLGDTAAVRELIAYRANVNAANLEGNTPLIYAARYNHLDTVLALNAPLTMQYRLDLNMQNKKGETALYWAAQKGYAPIVQALLAYDADKSLKTAEGLTALDIAKKNEHKEVVKLLKMNLNKLKDEFNASLPKK